MNAFRIHSSTASADRIAYLVLSAVPGNRAAIDLRPMDPNPVVGDMVHMSMDCLYELLMGKQVVVEMEKSHIQFNPRGLELVIDCKLPDARLLRQYRVWMAELALAWNIISGQVYRSGELKI